MSERASIFRQKIYIQKKTLLSIQSKKIAPETWKAANFRREKNRPTKEEQGTIDRQSRENCYRA